MYLLSKPFLMLKATISQTEIETSASGSQAAAAEPWSRETRLHEAVDFFDVSKPTARLGHIPTRRELVKEAARNPTATALKEKLREHLAHRWSQCPVSHTALVRPVVSDYAGDLYNKDAIIQFLLPAEVSPVDKAEYDKFIQGRVTSLKDVVEVIFETEHDSVAKTDRWICPITSKVLGPAVKAVYIVPCGHAFSHEAIKEMQAEQCSQCGAAYQSRDIIPILPSTDAEKAQVQERIGSLRAQGLTHSLKKAPGSKKRKANGEVKADAGQGQGSATPQSGVSTAKPSNGIKNAATASLTARVLEEEESRKKRRLKNENIGSLYSKKTEADRKQRDADFMSRGYSLATKAKGPRRRAGLGESKAEKAETDIDVDDVDANVNIADAEPGEYKPATTWHGLIHIGHTGHWQDIAPTEHDAYQP
ncbi:hypothetical protein DV736_g217, partial [Chaetothyriales sp. CBS 134916]